MEHAQVLASILEWATRGSNKSTTNALCIPPLGSWLPEHTHINYGYFRQSIRKKKRNAGETEQEKEREGEKESLIFILHLPDFPFELHVCLRLGKKNRDTMFDSSSRHRSDFNKATPLPTARQCITKISLTLGRGHRYALQQRTALKLVQLKIRPKNYGFCKQRHHRRRQTLKPRDEEIQGKCFTKCSTPDLLLCCFGRGEEESNRGGVLTDACSFTHLRNGRHTQATCLIINSGR